MSFMKGLFDKIGKLPINQTDNERMSALTEGCRRGHLETVRLLLRQPGINVNHRDIMRKTPFLRACEEGHLEIVKLILARNDVDINVWDDRRQNCFSWACGSGNLDIVHLLLERPEIDINKKNVYGGNAMNFAVGSGSLEIVETLLNLKNPSLEIDYSHPVESPITAAAKLGHIQIFNRLVQHAETSPGGFNIQSALFAAISEGRDDIFKALLKRNPELLNSRDNDGYTPFATACRESRPSIAKFLLAEPGIEINTIDKLNSTPMHWAITWRGGTSEIIAMLLDQDITMLNHKDSNGETPLVAASDGHADIVKLLLSSERYRDQIDINSRNNIGFTSLIRAAERGHPEVISLLLAEDGVDLNVQDQWGKTALIWAAYMGNLECVELLLNAGANMEIIDRDGKTALQEAMGRGHRESLRCIFRWSLRSGLRQRGYDPATLSEGQKATLRTALQGLSIQARETVGLEDLLGELNLSH